MSKNHDSVLHESVVFAAWLFLIYVDVGLLCDVAAISLHSQSKFLFPSLHSTSRPTSLSAHKCSLFSFGLLSQAFDRREEKGSIDLPKQHWWLKNNAHFQTLREPQTSPQHNNPPLLLFVESQQPCKSTLAALAGEPQDDLTNMVTSLAKRSREKGPENERNALIATEI